mmetsp:Transcript_18675/g.43429  ORF Transcript_18675/g.43429 Transcript_18675/m.43429 type:complete len:240 (+) Transcript_18675:219-938(+)
MPRDPFAAPPACNSAVARRPRASRPGLSCTRTRRWMGSQLKGRRRGASPPPRRAILKSWTSRGTKPCFSTSTAAPWRPASLRVQGGPNGTATRQTPSTSFSLTEGTGAWTPSLAGEAAATAGRWRCRRRRRTRSRSGSSCSATTPPSPRCMPGGASRAKACSTASTSSSTRRPRRCRSSQAGWARGARCFWMSRSGVACTESPSHRRRGTLQRRRSECTGCSSRCRTGRSGCHATGWSL